MPDMNTAAKQHALARVRGERELLRYAESLALAAKSVRALVGGNRDVLQVAMIELDKVYAELLIEYDKLLPLYALEAKNGKA